MFPHGHSPGDAALLLLVGLPGSGKSFWAQQFVTAQPGYRVVSTDAIRAALYGSEAVQGDWQQVWRQVLTQWQQGLTAIHQGQAVGVIYDATNARRRYRREAIAAARTLGFTQITLGWFDLPLAVALARNQTRSRQVPQAVIETMHRQMQAAPPTLAEGVDRIVKLP